MERTHLRFPVICLGLAAALASGYAAALVCLGAEPSDAGLWLYNITVAFAIACSVEADRRGRPVGTAYEYSAFLFFMWPIVLPVYLFKTRGWLGLVLAFGVMVLFEAPNLVALATYFWLARPT